MAVSKKKIVKSKLNSIHAELSQFCYFAKEHDCIEVTEWYNGEGFDLQIERNGERKFSFTHGEFTALKALVRALDSNI